MTSLRNETIKLAHENPQLREALLPLLAERQKNAANEWQKVTTLNFGPLWWHNPTKRYALAEGEFSPDASRSGPLWLPPVGKERLEIKEGDRPGFIDVTVEDDNGRASRIPLDWTDALNLAETLRWKVAVVTKNGNHYFLKGLA